MITRLDLDHLQNAGEFLRKLSQNGMSSQAESNKLIDWARLLDLLITSQQEVLKLKDLINVPGGQKS